MRSLPTVRSGRGDESSVQAPRSRGLVASSTTVEGGIETTSTRRGMMVNCFRMEDGRSIRRSCGDVFLIRQQRLTDLGNHQQLDVGGDLAAAEHPDLWNQGTQALGQSGSQIRPADQD